MPETKPPPRSSTVALTGATGVIGTVVLDELLARGHRVRALARPREGRILSAREGLTWIEGVLEDDAPVGELLAGADAIVHLAYTGLDETPPAGATAGENFVQRNVADSLRLLERAPGTGHGRFVFASSLAVYGPDMYRIPASRGPRIDEDAAVWPRDFYGAYKAAVEKFVVAAHGLWGVRASAFRIGCALGGYPSAARDPLGATVAEALSDGRIRTRKGAYVITVDDVARVLADALDDDAVSGKVFNTFDRWLDFGTLAEPLGEILGRRIERACDPAPPPEPPLARDRLDRWRPREWSTSRRLREILRERCEA